MGTTMPDLQELPFIDPTRRVKYRLSTSDDAASMRSLNSSFVTDRVFQIAFNTSDTGSGDTGFGLDISTVELDSPLHKFFLEDEDSDGDVESSDCFTVVAEDTNALSARDATTIDPHTAGQSTTIVAFISAKFSSWNSRLIITDIGINPLYRRQGIGGISSA